MEACDDSDSSKLVYILFSLGSVHRVSVPQMGPGIQIQEPLSWSCKSMVELIAWAGSWLVLSYL